MLSSGVSPPESRIITMKVGIASTPNWGIERAIVAGKISSFVTQKR